MTKATPKTRSQRDQLQEEAEQEQRRLESQEALVSIDLDADPAPASPLARTCRRKCRRLARRSCRPERIRPLPELERVSPLGLDSLNGWIIRTTFRYFPLLSPEPDLILDPEEERRLSFVGQMKRRASSLRNLLTGGGGDGFNGATAALSLPEPPVFVTGDLKSSAAEADLERGGTPRRKLSVKWGPVLDRFSSSSLPPALEPAVSAPASTSAHPALQMAEESPVERERTVSSHVPVASSSASSPSSSPLLSGARREEEASRRRSSASPSSSPLLSAQQRRESARRSSAASSHSGPLREPGFSDSDQQPSGLDQQPSGPDPARPASVGPPPVSAAPPVLTLAVPLELPEETREAADGTAQFAGSPTPLISDHEEVSTSRRRSSQLVHQVSASSLRRLPPAILTTSESPRRALRRAPSYARLGVTVSQRRRVLAVQSVFTLFVCVVPFLISVYYDGYAVSTPKGIPRTLPCGEILWSGILEDPFNAIRCGEDGISCRPFDTGNRSFAYRCNPGCASDMSIYARKRVKGNNRDGYTADSHICAAAAHAGVMDDAVGGCFELRLTGSRRHFQGVKGPFVGMSESFGWFPRSYVLMDTRAEDAVGALKSACTSTRWVTSFVGVLCLFVLCVIVRVPGWLLYIATTQFGVLYVSLSTNPESNAFWHRVNALTSMEFCIIPVTWLYWIAVAPKPFPEARRFPMDVFLLCILPFWVLLHLGDFQAFGVDFTLSGKGTQEMRTGAYVVFALMGAFAVPATILQFRNYYLAGLVPAYLVGMAGLGGLLAMMTMLSGGPRVLAFHFHHYMLGLALMLLCRGHTAYGLLLVSLGLSLFCSGVALWGPDPFFDALRGPEGVGVNIGVAQGYAGYPVLNMAQGPLVTGLRREGSDVRLAWALPIELAANWTCDQDITENLPGMTEALEAMEKLKREYPDRVWRADPPASAAFDEAVRLPDPPLLSIGTTEFTYAVIRNGVLSRLGYFPRAEHVLRGAEHEGGTELSPTNHTLDVLISMYVQGTMFDSYTLPLPFFTSDPEPEAEIPAAFQGEQSVLGYHEPDDDLCTRLSKIYYRLKVRNKRIHDTGFA